MGSKVLSEKIPAHIREPVVNLLGKVISLEEWRSQLNDRTKAIEANFNALYISVHPYLTLKEKNIIEFSGYYPLAEEIIEETKKIYEVLYLFEAWLDQKDKTDKPTVKMFKKIMTSKPGMNCDDLFAELNNIFDDLIEKKEEIEKKLSLLNKEIDQLIQKSRWLKN